MQSTFFKFVGVAGFIAALTLVACAAGAESVPTAPAIGQSCGAGIPACNIVSGYAGNSVSADRLGATISGGGQRGEPNQVTGDFGTVSGGEANVAGEGSTVAGGAQNTAINFHAVVGGGAENLAAAQEATVAGGYKNTASQRFATVGGGALNEASHINATVAGGSANTAGFTFAAVCGGTQNAATSIAATVSGGEHNQARGAFSAVLGGLNNDAGGYLSTVGGGAGNTAVGSYAAILGGFANSAASDYSVALGRNVIIDAAHPGAFLFADSTVAPFSSQAANEFAVRATGGVRMITGVDPSGVSLSGVRLSAGGGAWDTLSDYSSKSGFQPIETRKILADLMRVPITSWSYRTQDPSIRHIGPTAQDFNAAFHVGQDSSHISTVDADGVALAAIQELYRIWQTSGRLQDEARIAALERSVRLSNAFAGFSLLLALVAIRGRRNVRLR